MLSRNDPRDDGKAKRYFHLQKKYLAFKEQLNTRTRPEEIISGVPGYLTSSTQLRFFDSNDIILHSPRPFQRNTEKESLSPPPPLNPAFLTHPLTVETPSQQGPKRRRRRIQFLNYLDDHNAHGKQLRKRSRHKKFRVKPYKYSMGEEEV